MERLNFQPMSTGTFDPLVFARMKADAENKRPKPDDGLGLPCELCGGGGYLMDVWADGTLFSKPCRCTPMRQTRLRLKNAGLLERSQTDTFESFQASEPFQQRMLDTCKDFCKAPSGWLLLCGQPGCGKTHLSVASVGELAKQGYAVAVMPWVNTARKLRDFKDESREQDFKRFKAAQVLYVDDFLKGNPGRVEFDAAFELLSDRYNDRATITIISTERTPEELGRYDQAIRGRIVERCGKHICVVKNAPGRDYRLKLAHG